MPENFDLRRIVALGDWLRLVDTRAQIFSMKPLLILLAILAVLVGSSAFAGDKQGGYARADGAKGRGVASAEL